MGETTLDFQLKDTPILWEYQMTAKDLLKQIETELAENERHLDMYAHEMGVSSAPGESDYYQEKCEELMKQRRWLKLKYLTELRREIGRMKRRMKSGGKRLRRERNELKKKYFRLLEVGGDGLRPFVLIFLLLPTRVGTGTVITKQCVLRHIVSLESG